MADETWKDKFLRDLRNERKLAAAQIELDKKLHQQNVDKLKEMDELLAKFGDNK
jgi:hypothetical protein